MATSKPAQNSITGGCLCGQIRYTIDIPSWPPTSTTCQCTQCRKFTGSLVASFLVVSPQNVAWSHPDSATRTPALPSTKPPSPYREYHSSESGRRGFCSSCGSTLLWRSAGSNEEIEICVGSVDEQLLIGDRTERITSEELAKGGRWHEVLDEEGDVGRDIAAPRAGNFFWRNAVKGVTDQAVAGKKWVEDTQRGLTISE